MDWRTFIVEMTKAIVSWPLALIFGILLLRGRLIEFASSITRFKYRDLEVFREAIEEAQQEIGDLTDNERIRISRNEELIDLADLNPRMAVIAAWQQVDQTLKQKFPVPTDKPKGSYWLRALKDIQGTEKSDIYFLYRQLRRLRYLAVHSPEATINSADALSFINMAEALIAEIEAIDTLGNSN